MLDDRIAAGYDNAETPQGAGEWLVGYEILKKLGDKLQMRTLREFDRRFAGTELLQNCLSTARPGLLPRPNRALAPTDAGAVGSLGVSELVSASQVQRPTPIR